MTSILAQQLRGIASLDADRITSHHGAPVGKSYLFTQKEASALDLNAIFNIATSGFDELVELDPGMEAFEDELFSERSKAVDRMMLTGKENEVLGVVLDRCLRRMSRWITLRSAGKCLEWLIRRFRVHKLNVPALIHCFLPYHASPLFPRILSTLLLQPSSPYFHLLKPLQKSSNPLSRELLLKYMSPRKDASLLLLRDILSILPKSIKEGVEHRALYNFYTATTVDFVEKERNEPSGLSESVGRVLVEGFVTALYSESGGADLGPAVYPPLLLLVRSLPLSLPAYLPLLHVLPIHRLTTLPHRILTLLIVLEHAPLDFDGELGDDWRAFFLAGSEAKRDIRLGEVERLVEGVWAGVGLRKGWSLLLRWFAKSPAPFASIIGTMLAVPNLPTTLVTSVANELRTHLASDSDDITSAVKTLFAQVQQRYPSIVSSISDSSSGPGGKKRKAGESGLAPLDEERLNTSSPIMLAMSDDPRERAHGCRKMLQQFVASDVAQEDKSGIKGIVLDRLADQEVEVLDSLYGAKSLWDVITGQELLTALRPVFYDFATPRVVLLRHIRFISKLDGETISQADVFQQALFPLLVATKSRKVTVTALWDALAGSDMLKRDEGLFRGLGEVLGRKVEAVEQNGMIADVLARNIAALTASSTTLDFLVKSAGDVGMPNQVRLLALLVISRALPLLDSSMTVKIGSSLLDISTASDLSDVKQEGEILPTMAEGDDVLERIFLKPSNGKTMALLQSMVLTQLAGTDVLEGSGDWLQQTGTAAGTSPAKAFIIALYTAANSSSVPATLGAAMLRAIFGQRRDDSLLFLAGIWTDSDIASTIRITALRHGKAFVSACVGTDSTLTKDFQLIVPALLLTLMDKDAALRRTALDVLQYMAEHAPVSQVEPFALDTIYGETSQDAKLLENSYVKQYLSDLVESAAELALDASALTRVHAHMLNSSVGEGKKQAAYRREVTYVLGSHIKAWQNVQARTILLKSLEEVTGSKKLDLLSSLVAEISEIVGGSGGCLARATDAQLESYVVTVVSGLDQGVAKMVSRGESNLLEKMLDMLGVSSGRNIPSAVANAVLSKIRTSIFSDLSVDWQIRVLHKILDAITEATDEAANHLRAALKQLPLTVYGLVQIFDGFADSLSKGSEPAAKRSRRENSPSAGVRESLSSLMAFLESRDIAKLPESAALMSSCLNLLSETMQYQDDVASSLMDYVQQTLLVILTSIATKIRDPSTVIAEALSVETVIRLIRGAVNPRTSQQALLFIGSLAKLTPEAVLHNVMPIFTYIGSSDLQKDDMHSFSVVEKTVESIVPIMVNSAKARIESELDLLRDLQPLLRIFADMAGRLPSHRTVPFFTHLIETLGASDFLAAMVMLLSDRAAVRSARTGSGPSSTVLQLPLALIRSYSTSVEIEAIDSILNEVRRLLAFAAEPEAERPFLETAGTTSEQERQRLLYARGLTLMAFCKQALPKKLGVASSATGLSIAEQLLQLSTSPVSVEEDSFAGPIRQIANQILDSVLGLLPVAQFLDLSMQILQGSSSDSVDKILVILRARIPLVQPAVRESLTERFSALLRIVIGLIGNKSRTHATEALEVYSIITKSQIAAEDGVVAQSVPVLLEIAKSQEEAILSAKVLDSLIVLPKRLMTRMIPCIKPILDMSLSDFASPAPTLARTLKSLELSSQLISSIPGFIPNATLKSLLLATFALPTSIPENPINSFLGVVAKRIGTPTVFPMMFEIWDGHHGGNGNATLSARGLKRFFVLVQRAIRAASRTAFQPTIKPLFAFFLSAFDLRSDGARSKEDAVGVEKMVVEAFLDMVEKLNEQAFRPLFARIYDWAFLASSSSSSSSSCGADTNDARSNVRKVVVFNLLDGLVDKFKTIMTPYLGVVFESILSLLTGFAEGKEGDAELFTAIVGMLGRSFEVDEGAFWTTETLEKIIAPLGKQFPTVLRLSPERASSNPHLITLSRALTSLATSTTSDTVLKSLNSTLLLVTRSEDPQVRVSALIVLQGIWAKQEEMVQFVPETVAQFLAELLEDESAEVEGEARKLLGRIEGLVGDLSSYLE